MQNIELRNSQHAIAEHNDKPRENDCCGSDYVQKNRALPVNFASSNDAGTLCASLDGDADRLVYFVPQNDGGLSLIDGDRIAALLARFVTKHLRNLQTALECSSTLTTAVIQTAYANASATQYLEQSLAMQVVWVPTGVKHLHEAAKKYDIAIYFEANGHGTCYFSSKASTKIDQLAAADTASCANTAASASACALKALKEQLNPAVGDAIAVLLATEAIRTVEEMDAADVLALYTERPSVQHKLQCDAARSIHTSDAETRVSSHPAMQQAIDSVVAATPCGRAFVRPSGTEPVVRVYAEATSDNDAATLAKRVCNIVLQHLGSIQ